MAGKGKIPIATIAQAKAAQRGYSATRHKMLLGAASSMAFTLGCLAACGRRCVFTAAVSGTIALVAELVRILPELDGLLPCTLDLCLILHLLYSLLAELRHHSIERVAQRVVACTSGTAS